MPIQTIYMYSFNGDLSPLKGMQIKKIYMDSFRAKCGVDLSPLFGMPFGMPIEEFIMSSFNGDLSPLKGMPIKKIYIKSFHVQDPIHLSYLQDMSIQDIHIISFEGDLSSLIGLQVQIFYIKSFNGDTSYLKGMPIQKIIINSFDSYLIPLKDMPMQENSTYSFKENKLIITRGKIDINIVKDIKITNKNNSWYLIIDQINEQDSMNYFFYSEI